MACTLDKQLGEAYAEAASFLENAPQPLPTTQRGLLARRVGELEVIARGATVDGERGVHESAPVEPGHDGEW